MLNTIKKYYLLTKPGIVFGNLITVVGGFALGTRNSFHYFLLLSTLIGISFVMASACIFNNYIDRVADTRMERTKNRSFATGKISVPKAILFATLLGLCGILVLFLYANLLTALMGAFGFVIYVALYSFWKYRTVFGTAIGSIAGGVPPAVGYCAASGYFDTGAILLFLIMVFWQMPHFFSIAMYRLEDYKAASIPVLPLKKGVYKTKLHMVFYIAALTIAATMLTIFGYAGYIYLILACLFGFSWLLLSLWGFKSKNDAVWSRRMFVVSLVVVTGLFGMMLF